jgi:hypothetical protein
MIIMEDTKTSIPTELADFLALAEKTLHHFTATLETINDMQYYGADWRNDHELVNSHPSFLEYRDTLERCQEVLVKAKELAKATPDEVKMLREEFLGIIGIKPIRGPIEETLEEIRDKLEKEAKRCEDARVKALESKKAGDVKGAIIEMKRYKTSKSEVERLTKLLEKLTS